MKRIEILLLGLNVVSWIPMLGLAPRLVLGSYPPGDRTRETVSCHETDRISPALAVTNVSYLCGQSSESKG